MTRRLEPSPGFNVTLAAIGSAGRIDEVRDASYKHKWTLEDYFTLSHQNLLVVLSYLLKQVVDVNSLLLPAKVTEVMEMFNFLFKYQPEQDEYYTEDEFRASLVGIVLSNNDIVFNYNIPLRGHSASFVLSYNHKQERIELLGNFYRNLERFIVFKHIALYGDVLDIYVGTKLLSSTVASNAAYLRWNLDNADIKRLKDAITRMLILMYPESANIQLPSEHWQMIYALKDDLANDVNRKIISSALEYYSAEYQLNEARSGINKQILPRNFNNLLQCYSENSMNIILEQTVFQSKEIKKQALLEALALVIFVIKKDCNLGVELFKKLLEKLMDQSLEMRIEVLAKALQAAQDAVNDAAYNVRESGLRLFEILLQQEGVGKDIFQKALQAAQDALKIGNNNIRGFGLKLFEILLQQEGLGEDIFQKALQVAQDALKIGNNYIRESGLKLFEVLLQQEGVREDIFQEVFQVAQDVVNNENYEVRVSGFKLFEILLQQKGIKENIVQGALQAAQAASNDENFFVRISGNSLLKKYSS